MKFKIIYQNNLPSKHVKSLSKEPDTRPNSASKSIASSNFKQMVKSSYEYYMNIPKDELIKQSLEYIKIKQEKLRKIHLEEQKKKRAEKRQEQKQKQILKQKRRQKRLQTMKRKMQKQKVQPSRKSQRAKKKETLYVQFQRKKSLAQLSIQDIQKDELLVQEIIKKPEKKINFIKIKSEKQQNSQIMTTQESYFKKIEFKEVGTYQLGLIHQNILKIQEAIDTHLTFRKEMRKINSISVQQLIKYVRNQGFSLLNKQLFYLLIQINPDLYKIISNTIQNDKMIWVFSYRLQQIARRRQKTKQKMSQICIQELIS